MTPDKRRTTPLVQLLATGWSHAHGEKPLNLVPCRWRMTQARIESAWTLPGVSDEPDCFQITLYTLGKDEQTEGFSLAG